MSVYPFDITLDCIDENGARSVDGKWWPDEIAARLIDPHDPRVKRLVDLAQQDWMLATEHDGDMADAVLAALKGDHA